MDLLNTLLVYLIPTPPSNAPPGQTPKVPTLGSVIRPLRLVDLFITTSCTSAYPHDLNTPYMYLLSTSILHLLNTSLRTSLITPLCTSSIPSLYTSHAPHDDHINTPLMHILSYTLHVPLQHTLMTSIPLHTSPIHPQLPPQYTSTYPPTYPLNTP